MDVFRDLIDELKEENLLEQTDTNDDPAVCATETSLRDSPLFEPEVEEPAGGEAGIVEDVDPPETEFEANFELVDQPLGKAPENIDPEFTVAPAKPGNGREFYKKRAVGEMSHLQMVEHVLTGVEREYMKTVPKTYDDFAARKALNAFLQVSEDENSTQHSEAELVLMEEAEAWCTALAARDRAIPVANVRQYCENSRPTLSSQALVSLARFYRNVPYSESVRAKFDFVTTRLFSRSIPGNKRVCLFSREEMLNHIGLLYKEWSSVPLYSADDDDSKVLLTALSFEELANEAENASSFDLLVANDFFGRLGMFKESVSELFFAPSVTAAAIDCNIRVGNAYVTLIDNERVKMDSQAMYAKFGSVNNLTVSDAAARTLEIVDILKQQRDTSSKGAKEPAGSPRTLNQGSQTQSSTDSTEKLENSSGWRFPTIKSGADPKRSPVNRWLLGAAVLIILVSAGVFLWSTFFSSPPPADSTARSIELPNSVLRKHLKTARISEQHFYGLLLPSWDDLSKEKREEYLKVVFDFAKEKGCSQVSLLDSEGRAAGFASATKVEVIPR